MDTMRRFLFGEFSDLLYQVTKSDEYRRLTKRIIAAEKAFLSTLNKSQKASYEECVSLLLSREAVIIEEKSALYFTLGARMMCDILKEGK